MVVLVVLAAVWLAVRVIVGLRMVVRPPDRPSLTGERSPEREPRDAVRASHERAASPQDARWSPQDAAPVEPREPTLAAPTPCLAAVGLTLAIGLVAWQQLSSSVCALATARMAAVAASRNNGPTTVTGAPSREWVTALHETIIDRVTRPDEGPACFGGRDSTAYLRGWDDAVDWIGKARDAAPPTWGDVAYMTGWSDAVRAIDRARRCAIG